MDSPFTLIGIFIVMGLMMYFFMIRPGKKQQQKQQEMMNSLTVGTRVMLSSGIYGTIRHLGEKQAVIEISPEADLTILRQAIRQVVLPDDEEFEYSDGAEPTGGLQPEMAPFEADLTSPFAPEAEAGEDQPDEPAKSDEK